MHLAELGILDHDEHLESAHALQLHRLLEQVPSPLALDVVPARVFADVGGQFVTG